LLPGNGPLSRVPPVAAFLAVVAVFAIGALIGGAIGALVLGVLALGMAGLLASTWGALSTSQRAVRVFVLLILVAIAVALVVR
jgi:predicted neutral ceramidase superfamily lipid hydrolase